MPGIAGLQAESRVRSSSSVSMLVSMDRDDWAESFLDGFKARARRNRSQLRDEPRPKMFINDTRCVDLHPLACLKVRKILANVSLSRDHEICNSSFIDFVKYRARSLLSALAIFRTILAFQILFFRLYL